MSQEESVLGSDLGKGEASCSPQLLSACDNTGQARAHGQQRDLPQGSKSSMGGRKELSGSAEPTETQHSYEQAEALALEVPTDQAQPPCPEARVTEE